MMCVDLQIERNTVKNCSNCQQSCELCFRSISIDSHYQHFMRAQRLQDVWERALIHTLQFLFKGFWQVEDHGETLVYSE